MAGEVGGVGKGFFTEQGELKSNSQISKEEAVAKESAAKASSESVETSVSDKFTSAIQSVRGGFRADVNSIASVVNQDESNLEAADKAVRAQIAAAKELKTALKSGDKEKVEVAQKKLAQADENRNTLAEKVREDNDRVVTDRSKSLNVGNQQIGIVRTKAVRLEKTQSSSPDTAREAQARIEQLQAERKEIVAQRRETREVKRDLQAKASAGDARLSSIEQGTIRSIEVAQKTADEVSAKIVGNGSQALAASQVKESIAKQLLG